jgi:alpha-galactosidase
VHCNGDFYSPIGYTPEETALDEGKDFTYAPTGGRPCDQAFPYYRVVFKDRGLSLAIGWPGQWSVSFKHAGSSVMIKAGQEKTHLRLAPGETIRTPRIAIMSWMGDEARSINLWRRWYLSHVLPKPDGQPMKPLMALVATDPGEEHTAATEENQIRYMDKFKNAGFDFDVWWIDAGWYTCYDEKHERHWPLTGTWEPDPERFPHGLKPVSDHAGRLGAKLLIWMEPERVTNDTWLDTHHPEWLLKATGEEVNRLLNLGLPECRQWLTDHVCKLISENGIGIYRQDFNFEPLKFWRENDAPDRQGMNENLHVQGYLQFWDDLLRRNPELWIDSCSSGGRRNDLETMRRSVPLHYSDYGYGFHPIKLAFHHTLFEWIPYFKDCTLSWDLEVPAVLPKADQPVDNFSFHCGMAPMLFPIINIRLSTYDHTPEVKMTQVWKKIAELMLFGDYYPLTPFSQDPEQWVSWQFDKPENGEGFIQAIRLADCPQSRFTAILKAVDPLLSYRLENLEDGTIMDLQGEILLKDGLEMELSKRSGTIWYYRTLNE